MSKNEPTLSEFTVMWSQRGLDPDEHDLERLHAAWCLLHGLMQRMQASSPENNALDVRPIGTQSQNVFDPSCLVNRGGS